MSRQNTIPNSDNPSGNISALIPVWDMFNHHDGTVRTMIIRHYYISLFYYFCNPFCPTVERTKRKADITVACKNYKSAVIGLFM